MTEQTLHLTLASGEQLDVRDFVVEEGMSQLFDVRLTAVSPNADVDFEAAVGGAARFEIRRASLIDGDTRHWSGICMRAEQSAVDEVGLSTYAIRIVPELWLLSQRRNYRVFQDKSELDIVLEMLGGWGIKPDLHLDAGSYGKRRMRVQYAESDLDFVSRLLEDIGVAYYFEQSGGQTRLVLADAPNRGEQRVPVTFVAQPNERIAHEYVTEVSTQREVRPGRYTQSDVDYRKALNYPLAASSAKGSAIESKLERYHHNYGSFLWKGQGGGGTPVADDRGAARTNERDGAKQVDKRLEAQRIDARAVRFRTSAHDLRPGKVFTILGHARGELAAPLLVVASRFSGNPIDEWVHTCEARYTDVSYRPPLRTPKPRTQGVESATVTGQAGEEIHTDEFGRVRVHFHWDREGAADETSSCWVPVSQAWAGAGFGSLSLPRVGQEVLVDFLGSDPDRPIVMGRVFTTTTPPPYELPKYKMVSGLRSETYPRPKSAGAPRMGGGPLTTAQPAPGAPSSSTFQAAPHLAPPATGPAGGGMPVQQLGGGEPSLMSAIPGGAEMGQAQPGIFGGLQAAPEELYSAVDRMKSLGPDAQDQKRSANGLVFNDRAGEETVYLQAQKDLFLTAKNNFTASVGNNRAFSILGNDYEEIPEGYQATKVGKDRTVEVNGKQVHVVVDDILVNGQNNNVVLTKNNYYAETQEGGQVFQAKTGIMHRVETSAAIIILKDAIVIDAPKVYINPGPEVMAGIYAGLSPDAAVAQKQFEDQVEIAKQAIFTYVTDVNNDLDSNGRMLRNTMQGGNNPLEDAIVRAGVEDRAVIKEAAGRAYSDMNYPEYYGEE